MSLLVFVSVLFFSADAQVDPRAFISAGKGLYTDAAAVLWSLDGNTNVSAGYTLGSTLMVVGNFDHDTYSFHGFHTYDFHSPGNFFMNSIYIGLKYSRPIPSRVVSPYMMGLIGVSNARPAQDTVFYTHWPDIVVSHGVSGTTVTFSGAIGADLFIYKGSFAFVEGRISHGLNPKVYPYVMMLRAGIGMAFY